MHVYSKSKWKRMSIKLNNSLSPLAAHLWKVTEITILKSIAYLSRQAVHSPYKSGLTSTWAVPPKKEPSAPTSMATRTAHQTASSSPMKAPKATNTTHTTTSLASIPSLLSIHMPSPASQPKVTSQHGSGYLALHHPPRFHSWVPTHMYQSSWSALVCLVYPMPSSNATLEFFQLDTLVPSYCWPNKWLDSIWRPCPRILNTSPSVGTLPAPKNSKVPPTVTHFKYSQCHLDYHPEASPAGRAQQQALLSNICHVAHYIIFPW